MMARGEESFNLQIENLEFTSELPAIEENEQVFIPLRFLLNVLGAELTWDKENKNIIISADSKKYFLDIDLQNNIANLNDNMTAPIKYIDYKFFIPINFAKLITNYNLEWNNEEDILYVSRIPNTEFIFKNLPEVKNIELPKTPQYKVVNTITGLASWYGSEFDGRKTSSGEVFDSQKLTAAHRTLPFNTYVRVTFLETNKSTIVKINDRGPSKKSRILDLSKAAAEEIGLKAYGIGQIKMEILEKS